MSTNRRLLSLLLCLSLVFACLPAFAAAADDPTFTNMEDAAAYLRAELLNRNENVALTLRTTTAQDKNAGDLILEKAQGSGDDDLGDLLQSFNWKCEGVVQSNTYPLTYTYTFVYYDYSTYTTLDSAAEAAAHIRAALVNREPVIEFCVYLPQKPDGPYGQTLFEQALAHTGNPKEGDYLDEVIGDYRWSYRSMMDGSRYLAFYSYEVNYYKLIIEIAEEKLLLLLSHVSRVRLCATPWMAAHQTPLSLGFSRQEHWNGLPFPSPMHESEK